MKKISCYIVFLFMSFILKGQTELNWTKTEKLNMHSVNKYILIEHSDLIDTMHVILDDINLDENNNPVILIGVPGILAYYSQNPNLNLFIDDYKLTLIYKYNLKADKQNEEFYSTCWNIKDAFLTSALSNDYCMATSQIFSYNNIDTGQQVLSSSYLNFNPDSLHNEPLILYYIIINVHTNYFYDVTNALYAGKNKVLIFHEVYATNFSYVFTKRRYTFNSGGTYKDFINEFRKYPRDDSNLEGKRGFMYLWGDTSNFKLWFIEEEWKNCEKRLVHYNDTLSFIEIFGMDTAVAINSPWHCQLPTTIRKMNFSGKMLWEKQLPIKLHFSDIRRDKSPFSTYNDHFYLIDNYNTDPLLKGPYYSDFKLYKFDTSGNILFSKQLQFPFDSCGRASWPYPDGCGRLYTIFESQRKYPDTLISDYTVYQLDSMGNILKAFPLPANADWWGAKHMVIGSDNNVYLGATIQDSAIYVRIGDPLPIVRKQSSDTIVCITQPISLFVYSKGEFSYQWQKNGQNIVGAFDSVYLVASASMSDTGVYQCIVSNCFESDTSKEIKIEVLTNNFYDTAYVCLPDIYNFGNQVLNKTGSYIDSSINYLGCDSIMHLQFYAWQTPVEALPIDTFVCSGNSIELDAGNSGSDYYWNTSSTQQKIFVNHAGLYTVRVSKDSCKIVDSIKVLELALPQPYIGIDTSLCFDEESIWLDGGSYNMWLWYPTGEITRTIEIKQEGTYAVEVSDKNNCVATDTIKITNQCDSRMFIPTAFSPNGDGINDTFFMYMSFIDFENIMIFNRWGEKVFESNKLENGWDGTFKNHFCPLGVYTYIIKALDPNGQKIIKSGTLHLIR